MELLDFVVPLWAGFALEASAWQVGVLVAVEMAVSVLARPAAGILADALERRLVAAAGALLYAVSCVGYALAASLPTAYVAAAVGGVGGALLWVAVRSIIGERLTVDSRVYPRLLSREETGSWVAFVAGLVLVEPALGYTGVFWACSAACVAGAISLLCSPPRRGTPPSPGPGHRPAAAALGHLGRALRPMLLAIALRSTAGAAIGYLLLLHLQRGLDLQLGQIALVFLPGSIAASVLAERLHRSVLRYGRARVLVGASAASSVLAAALAAAPNPVVIAVLWVLSATALAAVTPVQQAVVAEVCGTSLGRGLGLYESASLTGGAVGALLAGVLYQASSWAAACLVFAAIILAGAVVLPWSLRALDVVDIPHEDVTVPFAATTRSGAASAAPDGTKPRPDLPTGVPVH